MNKRKKERKKIKETLCRVVDFQSLPVIIVFEHTGDCTSKLGQIKTLVPKSVQRPLIFPGPLPGCLVRSVTQERSKRNGSGACWYSGGGMREEIF